MEQASKLPGTITLDGDSKKQHPLDIKQNQMEKAFSVVQKSTISMGKFDKKLKGETLPKEKPTLEMLSTKEESSKQLKVLERILSPKEGKVDVEKAANKAIFNQQKKRKASRKDTRGDQKKRKK